MSKGGPKRVKLSKIWFHHAPSFIFGGLEGSGSRCGASHVTLVTRRRGGYRARAEFLGGICRPSVHVNKVIFVCFHSPKVVEGNRVLTVDVWTFFFEARSKNKDNDWFAHHKCLDHIITHYQTIIDGLTRVRLYTDGCPTQYQCRQNYVKVAARFQRPAPRRRHNVSSRRTSRRGTTGSCWNTSSRSGFVSKVYMMARARRARIIATSTRRPARSGMKTWTRRRCVRLQRGPP